MNLPQMSLASEAKTRILNIFISLKEDEQYTKEDAGEDLMVVLKLAEEMYESAKGGERIEPERTTPET